MLFIANYVKPDAPELRPGLNENDVSPGILGFLLTFLMATLIVIVARSLVTRMRRIKLRSEEAEDMLIERYQSYLPEEKRRRPAKDDLHPDRIQMLREKYPGYLASEAPEPQAPDSGRQ